MKKIKILFVFFSFLLQISCKKPIIEPFPIERKEIGEGQISGKINGVPFSTSCKLIAMKHSTGQEETNYS